MTTKLIWICLATSLLFSCEQKKDSVNRKLISDANLPKEILETYSDKVKIRDIEDGVEGFEIRKWQAFMNLDSFPVSLHRFYLNGNELRGEYYLFSNRLGRVIRTKEDLIEFKVDSFVFRNIPIKFYDSLRNKYDISNIDSFDLGIIKRENAKRMSDRIIRNVFYEQSSPNNYFGIFMSNPDVYPGLDKNLDKYAAFAQFTFDSLCAKYPKFNDWYNTKVQEIFDFSLENSAKD